MHVAVFWPGAEAQMHTHHGPTGSALMITKVQMAGPGAAARTHRDTDSISESDFCITVAQNEDNDVLSMLEADLDIQEKEGKPVAEKLAKVARSRFSVKLSENKLKEKLDSHLIPENCAEIRAPVLNVEIMEKGNLDRMARKNDAHLLNVQKLITTAATTLVKASDQLHHVTMVLADQSTCGGKQLYPSRFIEAANETLASNSDVIALLGTAQQELSIRRRYQLQHALPKDTALLRSNENIPITDKLSVMMPIKQSKQQERLSKSRTISGPTPTNMDKTGLF